MDLHIRDCRCVTILLPPGTDISSGCARLLVRCAQRHSGSAPWGTIYVEEFRGGSREETLVIARPAELYHVSAMGHTIPFIHKYFTD